MPRLRRFSFRDLPLIFGSALVAAAYTACVVEELGTKPSTSEVTATTTQTSVTVTSASAMGGMGGMTTVTTSANGGGGMMATTTSANGGAGGMGGGTTSSTGGGGMGGMAPVAGDITGGFDQACVAVADGSVKCWGGNSKGQLGNNSTTDAAQPVAATIDKVVRIAGGGGPISQFTCAVKSDGTAWCWGFNGYGGILGDGKNGMDSLIPVQTTGLAGAQLIATGPGHACASASADIFCWGSNQTYGALGDTDPSVLNGSAVPHKIPAGNLPGSNVTSLTAGSFNNCATFANGDLYCWGRGDFGQLGLNSKNNQPTPQKVTLPKKALQVAAGDLHACALLDDATVVCWGHNFSGQIGDGSAMNDKLTPTAVMGLSGVASIGLGDSHSCAVLQNGSVSCWGLNNNGQLGNGQTVDSNVPVAVMNVANAQRVEGGSDFTCAYLTTGGVRCWGLNTTGQLGDNTKMNSKVPVTPTGLN